MSAGNLEKIVRKLGDLWRFPLAHCWHNIGENAPGRDMTSHMFTWPPHQELSDVYEILGTQWQYPWDFACKKIRSICLKLIPGGRLHWMSVVNSLDNATNQVPSLFYNACRIFIPEDIDFKLGRHNEDDQLLRPCNFERNRTVRAASAADWNIWHVAFDIARHALRGGRKLKVVGFCSNLVGDRLGSSG